MQRRASESGAEGQRGASIASAQCKRAGARWMKAVEVEAEASCGNGSRAEASRHAKKITTHAHKNYFFLSFASNSDGGETRKTESGSKLRVLGRAVDVPIHIH